MLALSHTLIGGAAGGLVENVPLAFVLGVVLHFVADKTVHYFPKSLKNKTIVGFIDWLISAALIYLFYLKGVSLAVIAGAAGGLLVDVILIPIKPIRESKIGAWHIARQTHIRNYWYLLKDIGAILISTFIIWSI